MSPRTLAALTVCAALVGPFPAHAQMPPQMGGNRPLEMATTSRAVALSLAALQAIIIAGAIVLAVVVPTRPPRHPRPDPRPDPRP